MEEGQLEGETLTENQDVVQEADNSDVSDTLGEIEQLKADLAEAKDKYLRLFSEFDNFRRRTSREKLDLMKTANEEMAVALLPVSDDFERALNNLNDKTELASFVEGVKLIHQKFANTLQQKGVKKIDTKQGDDFSDDIHEAITQIPAPDESLKGKIIDVVEPGYMLGDKVVRFAKVVTGA